MKKLLVLLLAFALFVPCAAAPAEETSIHLGYIAPEDAEDGWYSRCAEAFAYAAAQKGVALTALRFDPGDGEIPEGAESEDRMDPAVEALRALIAEGVNGVAACPTSIDQARSLISEAEEAGMPIVIEGLDISAFYPPLLDRERPYVAAVGYGDSAAYAAALWLEDAADDPLLFHCALPETDPTIQAGLRRALADAQYLVLADDEFNASEDSVEAGAEAVDLTDATGASFGCVLADSIALAEGCAGRARELGWGDCPVASFARSEASLEALERGSVDMLAYTSAPVEAVETFKALHDFVTEGILPESASGFVQLSAAVATKDKLSHCVGDEDFETAYALVYPDEIE